MSDWYWKDGTKATTAPIGTPEWIEQMRKVEEKLGDMKYKVVKLTTLPDGGRVSTVWLGLDHSFTGGKPLIFETMVFAKDSWSDLDADRYSTESEALAGHKAMVKKWKSNSHPLR